MGVNFAFNWELQLIEWLQSAGGSAGAALASFFTMFGEEIILVAILGFIYWCWDKEFGKSIGLMIITGLVANTLLKNIVLRRRPYFDHSQIKCLKAVDADAELYDVASQGFSFPSAHAANSMVVYGGILAWLRQKGYRKKAIYVLGIGLPVVVGLSRFMLGVHYPTDVLVGWLMGAAIVILFTWLNKRVKKRWLMHLIIFLVSAVGIFYCETNDYFTGLGLLAGYFLALWFEERYVHFENTRSVPAWVLRMVCGFAIYLGLNTLFKLPFSETFLESGTLAAHLVRTVRYTIVSFLALGVYPLTFRFRAFAGEKKQEGAVTTRAVLFDFDGTVYDTVEGITKSLQYGLKKNGREAELDELRGFAGPPLVDRLMEVYGVSREEAEKIVIDFRERYNPVGVYESSPFPGIDQLLKELRQDGYKIGIATSKPEVTAELLLDKSGLRDLFDVVAGSPPGEVNNKPKWQIVQDAMRKCGADTKHAVLIGDTKYDVEGAQECGIPCIGVRWGYAAEGDLERAGAVSIAADMDELLEQIHALI